MGFAGVAHGVRSVGKEMRTPRRALDTQKTVEVGAMIMKGPKKVKKKKETTVLENRDQQAQWVVFWEGDKIWWSVDWYGEVRALRSAQNCVTRIIS